MCAFSDGFDDLRWLNGHGFALLRKNPRDDDFRGNFRDGKQKRSVAVLLDLLPGVHLIGLCELHCVAGQTNLDVADLFIADDVVERNGIDDLMVLECIMPYNRICRACEVDELNEAPISDLVKHLSRNSSTNLRIALLSVSNA